jgi:hypothetical protein
MQQDGVLCYLWSCVHDEAWSVHHWTREEGLEKGGHHSATLATGPAIGRRTCVVLAKNTQ